MRRGILCNVIFLLFYQLYRFKKWRETGEWHMDVVLFMGLSADTDGWTRHAVGDIFIRDFSCSFSQSMKKMLCFGFGSRRDTAMDLVGLGVLIKLLQSYSEECMFLLLLCNLKHHFSCFCGYHSLMQPRHSWPCHREQDFDYFTYFSSTGSNGFAWGHWCASWITILDYIRCGCAKTSHLSFFRSCFYKTLNSCCKDL